MVTTRVPTLETEDSALIDRLLAGDEGAFVALVDRYGGSLRRLARGFVSTASVAEEVVQETWVAILEGLPRFERRSSLKTWMFHILSNRAKTRGARENRSAPFSSFETTGAREPAVDPSRFKPNDRWKLPPRRWEDDTPERILSRREAMKKLDLAVDALPENQRTVVTLRDLEGLGSEEVCSILGISETNQRVLLHRARAKLRQALEEYVDGV